MSSLIKQVLIALLRFSEYLASDQTKCLFLNDEPHMLRSTLTEMNPVERKYYRFIISLNKPTQQEDVVATFFCPSQRRRKYVSNETPNDVSMVRLHDVIRERWDNVSRVRNNDVPLVRLRKVSNYSQMKCSTTSQW